MGIFTFCQRQYFDKQRFIGAFFFTAFLVIFCTARANAHLAGTYYVCPSGCDYSSVQQSQIDLNSQGIGNSVLFLIQSYKYHEHVLRAVHIGAQPT